MSETTQIVTVDRVDGDVAVLVDATHEIEVPSQWLPDGAVEGTALRLTLSPDPDVEAAIAERVAASLRNRNSGDIEL